MAAQAADGAAAAAGAGTTSDGSAAAVVLAGCRSAAHWLQHGVQGPAVHGHAQLGHGVAPVAAPRPAYAQDLGRGWATTGRLASTSQTRGLPRTALEHLVRQCVTEFYVGKKVEQGRLEYNRDKFLDYDVVAW